MANPAGDGYRVFGSDEDKIEVYDYRVKLAKRTLDRWKEGAQDRISRYKNEVKQNQIGADGHRVSSPAGVAVIDALFAALTAVEASVSVTNVGAGTRDQAYLATEALGFEWRKAKVHRRAEEAIKDALIIGVGWIKVAYEYAEEEQTVPRPIDAIQADIESQLVAAWQAGKKTPPWSEVSGNVSLEETKQVAVKDRVVVDYVPWDMVYWDPTVKRPQDLRWMVQVNKIPLWEVKNSPVFQSYVKRSRKSKGLQMLRDLKADSQSASPSPDAVGQVGMVATGDYPDDKLRTPDDDGEFVTVYSMYDFETGTVCTWAKGNKFLLNETVNPFSINVDMEDRNPFVPLILRANPDGVQGIGDMELILPILDEINLYKSNIATYISRMVPKIAGPAGAMSPAGKTAFKSKEYGSYIELEGNFTGKDLMAIVPPALPTKIFDMARELDDETKDATGMNELMQGLFPQRRMTATETAQTVAASQARQAEKRNRLTRFYEDIAVRILQLMQMFYDNERVLRVVGDRDDLEWTWSAEDITMEADLEVVLEPKEEKNAQHRQDAAMALLNIVAPMAPFIDVIELAKYALQEFGIPREVVRDLVKTPEQQQQELQQANQQAANQAQAGAGVAPPAANTPGPLSGDELAMMTNQGEVPPELLQASQSPGSPFTAVGQEAVAQSKGVTGNVGPGIPR